MRSFVDITVKGQHFGSSESAPPVVLIGSKRYSRHALLSAFEQLISSPILYLLIFEIEESMLSGIFVSVLR